MTEQIIGKVMMTFKGDYDATKQYDYLDVVTDQGSSFVCLSKDVTSKPSELSSDWQLIAKVGATPDTTTFALKKDLPDLTPYALKTEIPTIPSDLVHTADLKTVSDIANNAKSEADSNSKAIANKADKGDIPTSMSWDNITNKPQLATLSDIPTMPDLSGYATISSLINYAKKADLPDFSQFAKKSEIPELPDTSNFATKDAVQEIQTSVDSATNKAEQAQSIADANTKALQNVYTKEEADRKYWTAEQEQNASNVKSVNNVKPDDQGNVDIDLTGYAKTSDIPKSMTWSQITGKPNVATKSDLTWANISGKPSIPSTFNGTISDTSTNFNNLISEGHYDIRVSPSFEGKNGPNESDWGSLDVKVAGRMVMQTYYGDKKGNVYTRNRHDATWTAWRQGLPGKDGKSAYQIWLDNGHTGTETDFLNSLKGKDGTDVDLSGYATTEAVQKAQSTADNAYKYSQNEASLINKRIDNIKVPTESDFNRVKTITSGTLADLANKKGSYHYEIDCSPSDSPVADWGLCDVVVGEHYAKQTFTNTGNKSGDSYLRIRDYDGKWSDWREVTLWQ